MQSSKRTVETCQFRSDIQSTDDGEMATCQLLKDIVGIQQHESLSVHRDACEVCCESFEPSPQDINPVVASLLHNLTEEIIQQGGVPGCDRQAATKLNGLAERSLPAVASDEDDIEDIGQRSYQHLKGVTVDQISDLLPLPAESESHATPLKWMVGVTTSPRRIATLEKCLDSILAAGWTDPLLFVDGDVDVSPKFAHLETCRRSTASGAFPNYVLSMSELYLRDPFADAYMIVQDDAMFLPSTAVREYVDQVLWPTQDATEGPAIASLYCSTRYKQSTSGWHQFPESWVWGAVAFVFSRDAIVELLQTPELWRHRAKPGDEGLAQIDVVIGSIAQEKKMPVFHPSPSLVQHIGTISTIWKVARAVNARRADHFIGDQLDRP